MRRVLDRAQIAWWVIVIAVIGFYVVGLVMSVFNPLEMWVFTAAVVVLVALFLRHQIRLSRMLRNRDEPGHDEMMREFNRMRETRGW